MLLLLSFTLQLFCARESQDCKVVCYLSPSHAAEGGRTKLDSACSVPLWVQTCGLYLFLSGLQCFSLYPLGAVGTYTSVMLRDINGKLMCYLWMSLDTLQNEWKNLSLGVDSGSPLLKALQSLGVPVLTLRPEHVTIPMISAPTAFFPPKDYLTPLIKILSAQWTTHSRGFLNPFQLTVGTVLTLSSQNILS